MQKTWPASFWLYLYYCFHPSCLHSTWNKSKQSVKLPFFPGSYICLFSHYLCTFFQAVLENWLQSFCFGSLVLTLHWNNLLLLPHPCSCLFLCLTMHKILSFLESIKCLAWGRHWHKLIIMFGSHTGIISRFYKWKQVFSYHLLLLCLFLSSSSDLRWHIGNISNVWTRNLQIVGMRLPKCR